VRLAAEGRASWDRRLSCHPCSARTPRNSSMLHKLESCWREASLLAHTPFGSSHPLGGDTRGTPSDSKDACSSCVSPGRAPSPAAALSATSSGSSGTALTELLLPMPPLLLRVKPRTAAAAFAAATPNFLPELVRWSPPPAEGGPESPSAVPDHLPSLGEARPAPAPPADGGREACWRVPVVLDLASEPSGALRRPKASLGVLLAASLISM
jgi:hypothetical protein